MEIVFNYVHRLLMLSNSVYGNVEWNLYNFEVSKNILNCEIIQTVSTLKGKPGNSLQSLCIVQE